MGKGHKEDGTWLRKAQGSKGGAMNTLLILLGFVFLCLFLGAVIAELES